MSGYVQEHVTDIWTNMLGTVYGICEYQFNAVLCVIVALVHCTNYHTAIQASAFLRANNSAQTRITQNKSTSRTPVLEKDSVY